MKHVKFCVGETDANSCYREDNFDKLYTGDGNFIKPDVEEKDPVASDSADASDSSAAQEAITSTCK
jgi:hypothetical protein